ncbi:MAG: hypothetical protein EOM20_18625, partial [Spartobacteria bacterium]|nr:hypothetical protein [Spartobacteria bacterium]
MTKPLNRKALYDLVWSKPMTAAAEEYGLSDRGLAKLCERNSIPVPPRGYWAKKAAGKKVRKAPLIVLDEKEPDTAILLRKAAYVASGTKEEPALPEAILEAIDAVIGLDGAGCPGRGGRWENKKRKAVLQCV